MTTTPYTAAVEQLITGSHGQVVRATAIHPAFEAGGIDLAPTDLTISWDEERAPRVAASLTVPAVAGLLAKLDARAGVRVTIEAGYVLATGAQDVAVIANLGLRSAQPSRPSGSITLELASDELLVIDASPAIATSVSQGTTSAAISALIGAALSPAPVITSTVTGPAAAVNPVTDRWSTINDLADRIGAQVYDAGLREWRIDPAPVLDTPALVLTTGPGGTAIETTDAIDRDSWANYVAVRYTWRDASDVDHTIVGTAWINSGPYAITGPSGRRILIDDRDVQSTQADANAAAAALLARMLSRSERQTITAVPAWWLRPGMTVRTTTADRAVTDRIVSSVSFQWPAATMTVTSRLPDPVGTIGTSTPSGGSPTPDPTPPAKTRRVVVWTASDSATYKGTGVKRTDLPSEIAQGYYGATNGNQRSIILFTAANSTGSYTGQSVTSVLSGVAAGDIESVELELTSTHWYSSAGGTARIGKYSGTSIPATFTGGAPYKFATGWKEGDARWVNITTPQLVAELLAGTCRAFTTGPGSGTNQADYGKFASHAVSGRPRLRITLAKA